MVGRPPFPLLDSIRIAVCRATGFPLAIWFWWIVAAAWGILNARFYRDVMNPDGISYLDLAREALKHGPFALVNAHWGPLYPALIALWELILRPSPFQEFAYVHALNAVIYLGAAIAFAWFLRELILFRAPERGGLWSQGAFIAFAFAVFYRYTNADILPFAVTPDILLSATVFAAGALFFRIIREPNRNAYVALGGVLALGYYVKSIILPAGIILLTILFAHYYRSRTQLKHVLLASAVLVLICAPQIATMSSRVGWLSIGETGRLNYLWWVQGMRQFEGWTGTPGGDVPVHGPRMIMSTPEVLEFGEPIAGSYPLWYDPVYWHAGARVHFDLSELWAAFRLNLNFYKDYLTELRAPLAGLIILILLATLRGFRPNRTECCFLLWPVGLVFIYGLLHVEFRYVAPWLILFWVVSYSAFLAGRSATERLLSIVLAALILVPRLIELKGAYPILSTPRGPSEDVVIAHYLVDMGLQPNDAVAVVGEGFDHYYAHVAQLRIIAQVTDRSGFWSLPPSHVLEVESAVASTGAKVLLALDRPPTYQVRNWREVNGTRLSVLPLNPAVR